MFESKRKDGSFSGVKKRELEAAGRELSSREWHLILELHSHFQGGHTRTALEENIQAPTGCLGLILDGSFHKK